MKWLIVHSPTLCETCETNLEGHKLEGFHIYMNCFASLRENFKALVILQSTHCIRLSLVSKIRDQTPIALRGQTGDQIESPAKVHFIVPSGKLT